MPSFDVTLNLPGFTIAKASGFNPVIYDLDCHQPPSCPHCRSDDLRKKDRVERQVWHESVGLRRVLLRFFVCKFHCRACGKYFRQRFDGILPYQRSSEALKRQVYWQHTQGISRRSLAKNCGRSDTTIARYYDRMYDLENRKLLTLRMPRVLGIDEHFFSRRKRFATTFCDLKKRAIFDVAAGRSHAELKPYLHNLTAKNRVRAVCMDLSESYRSIARAYFPRALVIADRFHVVRLALHHLMKSCRQIDPGLATGRGSAKLLQKHARNLTERQAGRLGKNGITEGFHRKMKLIQRRAFGFRNFENDRRRVRALCA